MFLIIEVVVLRMALSVLRVGAHKDAPRPLFVALMHGAPKATAAPPTNQLWEGVDKAKGFTQGFLGYASSMGHESIKGT